VDVITQMQVVMILTRKILYILLFVIGTTGLVYSQPASELQETIKLYNRILQEETRSERHTGITTFVRMLEDIADKKVAQKLYIWIQSWHENGLFMDAQLKKISFEKINIKGNKADVETREIWTYRYLDRRINKVVLPDTKIFYRVLYRLEQNNGKWKIKEIKVLSEKKERINTQEGKR